MSQAILFKRGLTGWHVLGFFVAFFGVIFAVSATFMYFALTTYPGEEASAYRRGIYYNRTIAEARRQEELGWKVSAGYRDGRLVVELADGGGRPLSGERVDAQIGRPATGRFDRKTSLQEHAEGTYAAPIALDPGSWDVAVRVNPDGEGTRFNEKIRVWIAERP